MKKAMTEGNAWKQILMFALPLLLGNLFQQTYNMADAVIVGQTLGSDALAAVGSSSSIQFMVLGFCQGITTGFAIPVSVAFGAGREDKMRQFIFNAGILCVITAGILTALTVGLCHGIIHLLNAPADIAGNAYTYLLIIFIGIPCTILYNILSAILRAVGDSRTPFLFLAFSSLLNIGLDFYCILSLGWGVAGAAIATVFSQGVSGILCWILIARKFRFLIPSGSERKLDRKMTNRLLGQGLPMGFQFSIIAIGSMVMQIANNSLGTTYISGFAAGIKIKQFTMCPFDALGAAVSTFIAQNRGARNIDRIKTGFRVGVTTAVVYGILAGVFLITMGRTMSLLFVSGEETAVLDASSAYLRALGFFYWLLGLLIVMRMSVQGVGWSKRALLAGILEMIARTLVAGLLTKRYGFTVICYTDQCAWMSAFLYLIPTWISAMKYTAQEIQKETA